MPHRTQLWLLGLVAGASTLRFNALFANRFHADEALFASWARLIAVWRDPLLQTQPVDKPPLLFYLQALFYPLLGPFEWSARLPNLAASLLLVPLVGALAWHLYHDEVTAVISAALVTLAPLAVQFSATAFLDPLLTTLLVAALLAAVVRRPGWAGIWLGLALATKYQAVLVVPLLAGVAALHGWQRRDVVGGLAGAAPVLLLLAAWELARSGQFDLFSAQMGNFGGVRPSSSWELWPRLVAWLGQWRLMFGTPLAALLLVTVGLTTFRTRRNWSQATVVDTLLFLFIFGYAALHWLLAIPVWDRYLLPLLPLVALLLARTASFLWSWLRARTGLLTARALATMGVAFLLLAQVPAAWAARSGHFPLGSSPTADGGAASIAQFLAEMPYGTVLYDHWYSWQWRYHLFDKRVYVSWFPHPAALAEDLTAFGGGADARYVALPDTAVSLPVRRAITAAGFQLRPVAQADTITLYRLWQEAP